MNSDLNYLFSCRNFKISSTKGFQKLNLQSIDHFEDVGPCVVLASPGMLQNGLSRELFENWCTDSKNGCIIAGYCVEGTLAKVCIFPLYFVGHCLFFKLCCNVPKFLKARLQHG